MLKIHVLVFVRRFVKRSPVTVGAGCFSPADAGRGLLHAVSARRRERGCRHARHRERQSDGSAARSVLRRAAGAADE